MDHAALVQQIMDSPTYELASRDIDFLARGELRPIRMQLEVLKPELTLTEEGIASTIVVFGSTQISDGPRAAARVDACRRACEQSPDDPLRQRALQRAQRLAAKTHFYDAAREFGRIVSERCQREGRCDYVVVTGGGPGIMEAANRGPHDIGARSIGLNITLPAEQAPNPYITPSLCFQFQYFAMRKLHFLLRAKALVVFPGGFGTLDELFDALTLRQTHRMQKIPIILYNREYWDRVINFQFLADEGVIEDEHMQLYKYAETPQEAWEQIRHFHESASDPARHTPPGPQA